MADHAAVNSGPVQLSDGAYDLLRKFVELIIPGLGALYAAFAILWGWDYATQVVGSATALTVFGGIVLKFARAGYTPLMTVPPSGYDGKVVEDVTDEGLPILRVELDSKATADLLNKPQIVIKGYDAGA